MTDVYFSGTEEQWKSIKISNSNDVLNSATIYFKSVTDEDDLTSVKIGDTNEDGTIDATDASDILMIYASTSTGDTTKLTPKMIKSADLCKDGVIDVFDLCLMRHELIELNIK